LEFWRNFNIKNAVDTLITAWDDVSVACVRHAWRPVFGREEGDATDTADNRDLDRQVAETVAIAQRIPGFDAVTADEVLDLVNSRQTALTVEEMVEDADEQEQEQDAEQAPGEMTTASVRRLLEVAETFKDILMDQDPNVDRAFAAVGHFNSLLEPYSQLFKKFMNSKQQALITRYMLRPSSPDSPQPATVDDADIDEILAAEEDYDAVSNFDFGGFSASGDEGVESDSD